MPQKVLKSAFIYFFIFILINGPVVTLYGDLLQSERAGKTDSQIQSSLKLSGKSAIVFNKKNGKVLYGKDIHTRRPMGSISKLMTAIVAVDSGKLKDIVTVSSYATSRGGTSANLHAGEKLTLEQLIYAMILPSGNDAATAIAEHIGGTEAKFVSMMNSKAKQIGTKNTSYNNPRGSDGSTPYDLALIASYALDNKTLAKVLSTRIYEIPDPKSSEKRKYYNVNIRGLQRVFPEANGVKWGMTPSSGHCLIGSAIRDERYIITVVMDTEDLWEDTRKLLEYGFEKTYVPVTSVSLDRKDITMDLWGSVYLTASVKPASASNKNITWRSDDTSVASVNRDGRVIALGYGEAIITVKTECGNKTATSVISVPYNYVDSVKLDRDNIEMATGESVILTSTIYPPNANDKKIFWSSDNPEAVTVVDGIVTAVDVGEAIITVTTNCGGKTANCVISVPYIPPDYVKINSSQVELNLLGVGSRHRLSAEISPQNTSYQDITWISSDPSVVSVNNNGIITAEGSGEAIVTVITNDKNKTDTCIVTVNNDNINYGDANNDGIIDVRDAIMVLRYIVGLNTIEDEYLTASDVNYDGIITIQDAIIILRYIVGLY